MAADYSTREAARKLGIHLVTLQNYLAKGTIPAPPIVRVGGVQVRLWTDADIERASKFMPKPKNGRKTRWQKLRAKRKKPKKN